MIVELHSLTPAQVYLHMIQVLVPRPIAWVLSENASGSFNLAPFSYFNAVCSDPPLIMLSVGKKPDGSFKLDMQYFNYCTGLTMTNEKFDRLFGRPPRQLESELT